MTRSSKEKRSYAKFKNVEEHDEFLSRISKTLYYTKLPVTDCLSLPVTELAAEIFTEVKNGQTLERLDVEEASRISRNACVSPCSLVVALLYLEKLKDCNPKYLQRVAPSELFLVSLMVASKFLNDDGEEDEVFNFEWAESGHLSTAKMNRLEKEFLKAIDWSVYVHNQDFWNRFQRLERDIAYKEAKKRGWFSYTDLNSLLDSIHLAALMHTVLSISSICIATYAAGLITLFGSAMVATNLPNAFTKPNKELESNDVSELKYTLPLHENSQIELDEQIESMLLDSIAENSEICNESFVEKKFESQSNNTFEEIGWKWIFDSVMFWLPNSSNLKLGTCDDCKNNFKQNSIFVTKTDFMIDSDHFLQYSNNEIENIMKKESWDFNKKNPLHNWKYYINYFSKISLSHGQ